MTRAARAARASAAGYRVRPLERDDIDDFCRVHTQVWREAYRDLMRPEALAELDPAAQAERRREHFDANGPRGTLVASAPDGSIVAMAASGPSRDDEPPVPLELYAINVLAAHHGSGVADLLLDAALGDEPASLWVVEGNARAQAFYAARGFVADGATKRDADLGVDEVRLVRGRPTVHRAFPEPD